MVSHGLNPDLDLSDRLGSAAFAVRAAALSLWVRVGARVGVPVGAPTPITQPGDLPLGSYPPPLQPNPHFTGRVAELAQLTDALLTTPTGVVVNQPVLVGMGGVGKTQLAVQFAWHEGHRFVGVHWVSAYRQDNSDLTTEAVLKDSVAQCGRAMNLPGWVEGPNELERQVSLTLAAWKASGPRLVIVDNLEDPLTASAWLAHLRHSTIRLLVTSRQQDWPPALGLRALPLPTWTLDETRDFLRQRLPADRATEADLAALHTRLGGLPLPLELAAAYLERVTLSMADYLAQLNLEHPSLKNWRAKHPTATNHDKDVAATFALSWAQVDSPAARRLLVRAGYGLPNEPFPSGVLPAAAALDEAAYSEAIDLLTGLSLFQTDTQGVSLHPQGVSLHPEGVSLHPLLAEFARLQDSDHSALFDWARALAWRGYPGADHGGLYRDPALARYLRLTLADLQRATTLTEAPARPRGALCFHIAFLLRHFGDLAGAMTLYQQSLDILEGLGDLKGKSATLHAMANVYVTRGDLPGAMTLYQQSLDIKEGLGDLQGKSATLNNMAGIYVTRGDLAGAMTLYQQSLDIKEGLGDLQGKSATLVNMGVVEFQRQRYAEALTLLVRGLEALTQLGAARDVQTVQSLLGQFRQAVGAPRFAELWQEVTGQPVPGWLAPTEAEQPGLSVEEFIALALGAAREKRPSASQLYEDARRMARDSTAPAEQRALGRVLQQLMVGANPDLASLPEVWQALVAKHLGESP